MSKEAIVKRILDTQARLDSEVSNWNSQWQVVGEFVTQMKMNFEQTIDAGEFLNEDIFDSTATFASVNASSSILGLLWASSAKKSVSITAPDDMEDITQDEQKWYDNVASKRFQQALDDPEANLGLALDEYMQDQVNFGTSGVGVFWEDDKPLFKSFSVKEMRIDEGKNGIIDFVTLSYEWTIKRYVETYGVEEVSTEVAKKYNEGSMDDKILITIAYESNKDKKTEEEFPYKSYHIEKETKHLVKEGGFDEFPIPVARFRKLIYEKYGRSPAMNALPDIREINILREAIIVATEKILDPPLALLSSSSLGNQIVDTSSGALNVIDPAGSAQTPIFPIHTVGDMSTALARIEDLKNNIAQHFYIDRLLDFNNDVQMTATETNIRDGIRDNSLSSLINRQLAEMFVPLTERSFNLMLRNNQFGYIANTKEAQIAETMGKIVEFIPDRIAKRLLDGGNAYQVKFSTPASRMASAEELQGMVSLIDLTQRLAQTNPNAVKYLNIAEIETNGVRLLGAPAEMIRTEEEVQEMEDAEKELIMKQQQLDQVEQASNVAKNLQGNKKEEAPNE